MTRRTQGLMVVALVVVIGAGLFAVWRVTAPARHTSDGSSETGGVVHAERSGDLEIVLRSPTGTLRTGRNAFTIEFRRASNRTLVDVGTVRATANMAMPGMVMPSGLQVASATVPGRYEATAEFGMAGGWQMAIEWDGPAGRGSVSFQGPVQ